ncbi:phytoene desaturase family protein [Paracraurococcus ruber]|uniref:Phytoene desaturase n=1 Tax=Paracraurococcus ruber TaxID=77675 RepID=A0ABS1D1B9_9PROT|nr:phytoene desaturase family protein [Paracraurococcus ruber]MBK1660615.1 phytoene desaturase [Paracraurococcus ruber]TDG26797.1 phytoene desaturase [Paracraurococcus ruber]
MNAPLAAPALQAARSRIAIIGAGPGGLAAAILLAAKGAQVTIYEKDKVVGGRTRTMATPEGYRFDLGPTFFLYPRVIAEIFESVGTRLEDEVKLVRVDPLYRLFFEDAASVDATADPVRMEAEIAKLCPQDAKGFRPFIAENRAKLDVFRPVLEKPFESIFRFLHPEVLKSLPLLRPHSTVDRDLARHFSHPLVRLAFSFQTKYLGMSPFRCPSLFTILSFLEYEHGIWHIEGGVGSISEAMARVARQLGVDIRLDTAVERVSVAGKRAHGVQVGGRHIPADAVIMNADFAHAMPRLVPEAVRPRWNDRKIETARYSCSTFMLYLGIEGSYPDLAHHTVMLSKGYERNIRQLEDGVVPDEPSLYLHNPSILDPTMAPPGHSALYLLVPVPNMRDSAARGVDWATETPRFRKLVMQRLALLGLGDLEARIRYEKVVTPADWLGEYAVGHGATFNLRHDLAQMLCFRPQNRFGGVQGLYLVGGGTHPGSGLPVIYEGARITTALLSRDLGLKPGRAEAELAAMATALQPAR